MIKRPVRRSKFFFSKQVWRYIYFIYKNGRRKHSNIFIQKYFYHSDVFHNMYRYAIFNKSSNIIKNFAKKTFEVYLGCSWGLIEPSTWHVGYKFGEFFRTRKYEIYRDKLSRKAEKKRREQSAVFGKKKRREREFKIEVIRKMKMFNMRRRLNLYKTEFKSFEIAPKKFYTPSKKKHLMV